MFYKTMILELLQQQPEIHDQLRKERRLLTTMEQYAAELKASHQAWTEFLSQLRPGNNKMLLASEALDFALKEMQDRLRSASQREESARQFLDAAMFFIRTPHTPRG